MDFQALIIVFYLALLPPCFPPLWPAGSAFPALSPDQQSGIRGKVYLIAGNRMPAPRHPIDTSGGQQGPGVPSTVCVFELTNDSQVVRQGTSPYCQAVHTRLIRQTNTDEKGNFSILLPPGTYSVFTKAHGLFYATRRDEKNNIAPVEVLPGKITRVSCSVESDHKAVY